MKKSIIEVIKANRGAIVKRALIVGGTAIGLAIVGKMLNKDEECDIEIDADEVAVDAEVVETSDEEN